MKAAVWLSFQKTQDKASTYEKTVRDPYWVKIDQKDPPPPLRR